MLSLVLNSCEKANTHREQHILSQIPTIKESSLYNLHVIRRCHVRSVHSKKIIKLSPERKSDVNLLVSGSVCSNNQQRDQFHIDLKLLG